MKNIQECLGEVRSISEYVNTTYGSPVNEGLKDWFNKAKEFFKDAYQYLKGVVVKLGTYFLPVNEDGDILPAITPMTAGAAYKDGSINKTSTFVYLEKQAGKLAKLNNKLDDAIKMYGNVKPTDYWMQLISESEENPEFATIVENYMEDFATRCPELVKESKGFSYINTETNTINEVKLANDDPEAKYNVIVDNNELKMEIKMHIRSKELAPLLIWGAPGIGKTAVLRGVLKEMAKDFPNYNLIVKTLSNETPDNFTLPTYVETPTGKKADDIPKTWLPVYKPTGDEAQDKVLDENCGHGLLFIDELSRATPQVLNVVLPLINERIFNGYNLGSGWTIVVASNRMSDEKGGQSEIGNALANRFIQVYYEPTVHTWREWADKQGFISPLLLQWLSLPESENMSGAKYYYMDPNEDNEGYDETKIMCTPRSWTNAMRKLAVAQNTLMGKDDGSTADLSGFNICNIPTRIIQRQLNTCIPAQAVDAFVAFLDVISKIGDFDRAVDAVWNNNGKGFSIAKKDLHKITLPVAQLVCTAHNTSLPTEKEFESFANWLVSCDSDQLASYTLDIFKNTFIKGADKKGLISGNQDNIDAFFILKRRLDMLKQKGNTGEYNLLSRMYEDICKHWGCTPDTAPDYFPSLKIIKAKYGESFKSAVVGDWADALG